MKNTSSHQHTNTNTVNAQQPTTIQSKQNSQTTIHQYTMASNPWKTKLFGEKMKPKASHICRIVSQNINCMGLTSSYGYKATQLKNWLYRNNADICGMQEIGLAQQLLPRHDQLVEGMRDFRRDNIGMSSANNKHENIEKMQYGGTAVFAYDLFSYMVRASGCDNTGLGRWSWLQLEGHKDRRVRVISAYNPCRTPTNHYATVYSQHKRFFNSNRQDVCPRKQFRRDLCNFIHTCQANGEWIILLIDCNEN